MCDACYWEHSYQPCSYVKFTEAAQTNLINSTLVPIKYQGKHHDYIMWTIQFRNGAVKRFELKEDSNHD